MAALRCSVAEDVPPPVALARGRRLFEAARDGEARLSVAVTAGPAVALGARQRAGRVVDLDACARAGVPVLRRATTGTAAYLGPRAVVWALALPRVGALLADATARTALNRNVRLLLAGMTRAGALAQYFGREWAAVRHRPAAVLGYEIARDGRVLVEAVMGWDEPAAVPAGLAADAERALDRWRGHEPIALVGCVTPSWTPGAFARSLCERAAERAGAACAWEGTPWEGAVDAVTRDDDPVPAGLAVGDALRVPIGYVEAARGDGGAWLGGDVLAATWWLDEAAAALARGEAPPEGAVLEGAREDDLVRAFEGASHARREASGG